MGESRAQEAEATVHSLTIVPPVMGWNTRDPISNMDPEYAVEMENYFPANGTVSMRNGYLLFASSVGTSAVASLSGFEYGSSSFLVAVGASGGNRQVYSISSGGTVTDIDGGVNFSTSSCQMLQFRDRIFIKPSFPTGTSDVYHWTGTGNIVASAFTGPGGDDKDLMAIGSYKSRLYFGQYTAPSIWYGGVDAVSGALTEFPLGSLLNKGTGSSVTILFVGSAVRAKQYAEEELLCIVTVAGDVLVYSGDYPTAANWDLVGKYSIPPPIGPRGFFYSGSDLNIVTRNGVISFKKMITGDYQGAWPTISDAIESAFIEGYSTNPVQFIRNVGIAYPQGQYLLANVDIGNDVIHQYVMNTTTGGWCKFTGQHAESWAILDNDLYFGSTSGNIFKADTGYFDDNGSGLASNRTTKLRFAYNYFGDPEHVKAFVSAIPTLYESEGLSLTLDVDVDYANTTATSTVSNTTDTSYKLYQPICGLKGIGTAGSIRLDQTVTTKRRSIQAVKVIMKTGTIGK